MKTALFLAFLTLAGSAVAGQPKSNVIFNPKGQVIAVVPATPAAPAAPAGMACTSHACCAK
ncbi:hypothetical protein [Verrucomicrobium sp. BvORR034]|jgi:hypothetical protein|uniref:hypothetical protein n=1 Tax=Verrucomicrobium sp. BvORR034 TaxID=1396418 RepID=UPI00067936BB|nr:hypothetical protein [Verrucomicrobium sp. BvORR034]